MRARIAAAAVLLLGLAGLPAAAAERTLVIQSFAAAISVAADGSIAVQETIEPRFTGSWNGIYRTIPVDYRTPQGLTYSLRLQVQSVTDGFGNPLRFESTRDRQYRKLKIWVPGATDTTARVEIRYAVANALRFFEDHDELYWNVTGDEWAAPIESTSAVIFLPGRAEGIRATAFRGALGSRDRNDVAIRDGRIFVSTPILGFRQGLTVVAGWNPGVVHRPTLAEKVADFFYSNALLTVPFAVFVLMWLWWFVRGRDRKPGPIVTLYEPPADMTPAELGTLIDGSVDLADITATVVDLAVRGFIRITATPAKTAGAGAEYSFTSLRPHTGWEPLKLHERMVLDGLFRSGDVATIEDIRVNEFYTNLPTLRETLYSNLMEREIYAKRPASVVGHYARAGFAIMLLPLGWAFLTSILGPNVDGPTVAAFLSAVASGIVVIGFGFAMPVRTARGVETYARALGFQEFLSRVDADRFERVIKTPELFEKYLPYAMALRVEHNWARAFEGIYTAKPDWLSADGGADFGPDALTHSLTDIVKETGTAMTWSPRVESSCSGSSSGRDYDYSSSSGFDSGDSGGSSGGGFGGGGGGGF